MARPLERNAPSAAEPGSPDRLLSEDHRELDEVLRALIADLNDGDPRIVLSRLDLFWARLAMHIRAEHLHLFPAILEKQDNTKGTQTSKQIKELRADHDFFMHSLAHAIQTMRQLAGNAEQKFAADGLSDVRSTVDEVEKRLARHNEAEENHIYLLAATILSEPERKSLVDRMRGELSNPPARFT